MIDSKITLVGAGPGDPELLTIAGLKALQTADVVLYDALVDETILDFAPQARHIFVGKRRGFKRFEQEEINAMLVEQARQHGHIVRLKGGDSFVFGRGREELDYAEERGIETRVIPGISSSIAGAASVGIPVTKRGVCDGFWVITATKKDGSLSRDIELAARSNATVVVLMGMAKLRQIAGHFMAAGRSHLPVAIVQNATRSNQKAVLGRVRHIEQLVETHGLANPAVMIFGEVAGHGELNFEAVDTIIRSLHKQVA